MKKVYLLPNVITAFGLSCGLFVIFKLNMTPLGGATTEVLTQTAGILLLAVFADLLDGGIARAMKAESDFGGFFDSLADAITFGVAPSVIVLKSFSMEPGTELVVFSHNRGYGVFCLRGFKAGSIQREFAFRKRR